MKIDATEDMQADPETGAGWEAAGRKIAPMLGSYSAAVITAADPLAAAYVALGIGLAEAEHRRVAIGDLVGEVAPIQSLATSGDPHGISDSFTYGVSLNKIAQPIDTTGNLFVMPSGTGGVSDPEIFRNSRWQRLANGFREVGALLLLVAPADSPALRDLIDQLDGVVLVGKSQLDVAPYMNVLARVPAPLQVEAPKAKERKPLPVMRLVVYLVALVALVAGGIYLHSLDQQQASKPAPPFRRKAVVTPPAQVTPAAPVETLTVAPPANLADSANATLYAVEIAAYNTPDDAATRLNRYHTELQAGTISPVPVGASREIYYKLVAGAFGTEADASAFLDGLRHKQILADAPGTVVRTPYALLLDSADGGRTQALVRQYAGSKQAVYVLVQPNGTLKLYAGAFERPEDSATLMAALRTQHFNPVLVYRTGRLP